MAKRPAQTHLEAGLASEEKIAEYILVSSGFLYFIQNDKDYIHDSDLEKGLDEDQSTVSSGDIAQRK